MIFFRRSRLTPIVAKTLLAYDDEVRRALPPGYSFPIRMRDWELYQVIQGLTQSRSSGRILDTGAYNTFLGVWLANRHRSVTVSDLLGQRRYKNLLRRLGILKSKPTEPPYSTWSNAITQASERIRLDSIDLTAIDKPDGSFDAITCISVIEHIPDFEKAVAEMMRCLKPGGRLFLTTDCAPTPRPYQEGTRYFSHGELLNLLAPYHDVSPVESPDFAEENWCYARSQPIVTCYAELLKE